MLRSMAAAHALVAEIDNAALAAGKKITRQFCREILERYQTDESRA